MVPNNHLIFFFDSTFSNLKYDENSNKIQGLKLVLNVKQQIQLKNQKQFLQQPPSANNTIVPTNNNNCNTDKTTPITVNVTPAAAAVAKSRPKVANLWRQQSET